MPTYLITGANKNLGLYIAKQLAADTDNLVICLNRTPLPSDALSGNLKEVITEITDTQQLKESFEKVEALTDGKLDVLIQNAGMPSQKPTPLGVSAETDLELEADLIQAFKLNSIAPVMVTSTFLPLLRAGRGKKIWMMTSAHGIEGEIRKLGMGGRYAYSMSKSALNMFTLRLHNDLKSEGFIVVAVSPSVVLHDPAPGEPPADGEAIISGLRKLIPDAHEPYTAEEGARVLLNTFRGLQKKDSGRVVGMWGSEDRWM